MNSLKAYMFLFSLSFMNFFTKSQIANYVTNGGFEQTLDCSGLSKIDNSLGWDEIGKIKAGVYCHSCFNNVPYNGYGFQYPKTGDGYAVADFLVVPNIRVYMRNKLKTKLTSGITYCVKLYCNIGNNSTYGISSIGAFFENGGSDTINYGSKPLTYIIPQVQNPNSNFVTDTLSWTVITGSFVSNGDEKYLIIGNFMSDTNTNKVFINPTYTPTIFSTVSVDDVSCIPIDLPAFAGNDTTCIPGTTVYLGRPRDVGIDEACTWYKWPDMTNAIATGVAGLTVSPVVTSTYIVKQQLWCSGIKYDTVIVYKDGVGIPRSGFGSAQPDALALWPNPGDEMLNVECEMLNDGSDCRVLIKDCLGRMVKVEGLKFKDRRMQIETKDLPAGVYSLFVTDSEKNTVQKRFAISR